MAINKLIIAFVALILGIVLLGTVATLNYDVTSKSRIVDESIYIVKNAAGSGLDINTTWVYTLNEAPTGWKTEGTDCDISNSKFANSSGSALTVTTDYVLVANTGTFTLKNTSNLVKYTDDNLTDVSYSYCGDDYLNLSWGRTVINLVGGFFALAILFVSLAMFYSIGKEAGII